MATNFKLFLVLIATTFFQNGYTAKVIFQNVSKDITDDIFVYYIEGPSYYDYVEYKLEDALNVANESSFNPNATTVFYFHGFIESAFNESVVTIGTALLQNHTENILVFDYSNLVKLSFPDLYIGAVLNATPAGIAIGEFLQQYVPMVQEESLLHLIGHSLGGQIMSQAARTYGAGRLPWLTGLDPAGPGYVTGLIAKSLSASDGIFVDVISTDAGFFGTAKADATVNFYPNRGTRIQPYCIYHPNFNNIVSNDFCSHWMSWRYYAESITNKSAFLGKKCIKTLLCDSDLALCSCQNDYAIMGYDVNKNATGTYYLKTNINSPWGRGMAGTYFYLI